MSAPTSGPSSGNPSQGFYPDPSIPGYIRYWNGTAWVPGTSRPEPRDGEPMPAPPPGAVASPAEPVPSAGDAVPAAGDPNTGTSASDPATVAPDATGSSVPPSGTGPGADPAPEPGTALAHRPSATPEVWGSQDSGVVPTPRNGDSMPGVPDRAEPASWDDPGRLHGMRPGAASAWQADPSQQSGFGDAPSQQLSWGRDASAGPATGQPDSGGRSGGAPAGDPPTTALSTGDLAGALPPGESSRTRGELPAGSAAAPPALGPAADAPALGSGEPGTMAIRLPRPGSPGSPFPEVTEPFSGGVAPDQGRPTGAGGQQAPAATPGAGVPDHTVGLRVPRQGGAPNSPAYPPDQTVSGSGGSSVPPGSTQQPAWAPPPTNAPPQAPPQQVPQAPGHPAHPGHQALQHQAPAPQAPPHQVPGHHPAGHPAAALPDGGLPGGGPGPWRPPANDPFAQAAQVVRRPSGLGKRLVARLIDSVVVLGVTGAVGALVAGPWQDHIQGRVDAVEEAGVTRTVWLVDGTTWVYLAAVLGAFLVLGLLYEVLPTGMKGRTLGKKLCGLTVLDVEQQEPPGFSVALRRWLVCQVLGGLVISVAWCLFDRPWRQCWHDKAASTFVTGDAAPELRL